MDHSWGRRHTGYLWTFLSKPGCTSLFAIALIAQDSLKMEAKKGKEDSEHRASTASPEALLGPAWLTRAWAPAASCNQDLGLGQALLSGTAPPSRTLFLMQIPFCDLAVPQCISRDLP